MFIIHLGYSGFPQGNATFKRILLTFKAIKEGGENPLIINKHSVNQVGNSKRINRFQGIPYVYTSAKTSRPDSFLQRNLNKLSGHLGELGLIAKKRKKIDAAIFYESSFILLCYYRILSKLFKFKLLIQYVEFRSSLPERQNIFMHFNDILFDSYSFYLCDGIIVISEYLKNRAISKKKSVSYIKVPTICDFDEFRNKLKNEPGDYLMYCSSIGYFPVIEFIIDLFCKLRESDIYRGRLILAIGVGDPNDHFYRKLVIKIKECGYTESIVLKTNVPHLELISLYQEAEFLIVPIRNIPKDIAGFHHKVGEYCAAGKPIISNDLGEMKYYFRDGISAILAPEYTIESYTQKLNEIINDRDRLASIAEAGRKVGLDNLNYKNYSALLTNFIVKI
jgi:glycosyltransferase involved in cell wall biosynthesis